MKELIKFIFFILIIILSCQLSFGQDDLYGDKVQKSTKKANKPKKDSLKQNNHTLKQNKDPLKPKKLILPPRKIDTKKFCYEETISLDTTSKNELFKRAIKWFEHKYKTQNFELKNEDNGRVIHNGTFPVNYFRSRQIKELIILYTISLTVQDGKYKYDITDFYLSKSINGSTQSMTLENFNDYNTIQLFNDYLLQTQRSEIFSQIDMECKKMIEELKSYMSGQIN
jgi:hypothetical protein